MVDKLINAEYLIIRLEYQKFTSVFYEEDYFVKNDELLMLKSGLKQMLEKGEIDAVNRSYGEYEGFNRIK